MSQPLGRNNVRDLGPEEVARGIVDGRILLVDVREPTETDVERYPEAFLLPMSMFDPHATPDPGGREVVFARRSGNPTTFDYGRMREFWLIHACTNWMGDDAWLWKLSAEFRAFNYVGDTQWITGEVTRHYEADGGRPAVDVALRATNQRGQETTPGTATILLPSRSRGPVRLPDPPGADLDSAMRAIVERFAQ